MHEGLTGRIKAELPDEYLEAVVDLQGRGVSQLLTVGTAGAGVPEFGTIRVRSLQDNRLTTLWQKENAAWETWEPPLPANVQSTATFGRATVMSRRGARGVTVAFRQASGYGTDVVTLSTARWAGHGFLQVMSVAGRKLQAVGLDGAERLLVRVHHPPGEAAALQLARAKATLLSSKRVGGNPGPVAVAWPDGAQAPTVIVQGRGAELVAFEPPGEGGAAPVRRIPGRGQSTSWPEARGPVIADLEGDGQRQLLFAGAGPDGFLRASRREICSGAQYGATIFRVFPGRRQCGTRVGLYCGRRAISPMRGGGTWW